MTHEIRSTMGSVVRTGHWRVPHNLPVRLRFANAELDFREAELGPGTTTIDVNVAMGNLEIVVPVDLDVELQVNPMMGNCELQPMPPGVGVGPIVPPLVGPAPYRDPVAPPVVRSRDQRLVITGVVRMGNVEVIRRLPGENPDDARHRERADRHAQRHARHLERAKRWEQIRAERRMWMEARRDRSLRPSAAWAPWWIQAKMRRKIFMAMAMAAVIGALIGHRIADGSTKWWLVAIAFASISFVSGAIAYRLTRPLIVVAQAARDIGEGKLDTRIDVDRHGGETQILATAINDMAARIEQQIKDQKSLLAAVSHELRTPLGHMRVLIETARDTKTEKPLNELEREILVLDDLVGRLLASSRLEFGNLDLRATNLGELATDVATASNVAPELIEAIGDVETKVDPTLVRRAIANLLDNARTYGGGAVAFRIERRGAQIAFEVDDAGPGVPADRRADAFRAFVPSSGGLGLGLALVSRIAVAHGGGAWIADRPGGGARIGFTVAVAS